VCESSGSLAALEGHVLSLPTVLLEIRHVNEATVVRSVPRSAGVRHRRVVAGTCVALLFSCGVLCSSIKRGKKKKRKKKLTFLFSFLLFSFFFFFFLFF